MSDCQLIWALKTGDMDEIEAKFVTTEDVNRPLEKRNPLHYAADFNQPAVLLYLLSKGADINAIDKHGFTPLLCACYESNIACVEILIKEGADKTFKGPDGCSPLEAASECEAIKALLKDQTPGERSRTWILDHCSD